MYDIIVAGTKWASSPGAGVPAVTEAILDRRTRVLVAEQVSARVTQVSFGSWLRASKINSWIRCDANLYFFSGSSYSSEADEGPLLDSSRQSSNNTSPSHTLETGQSNSIWYDELDNSGLEPEKKKKALDVFQSKMNKTKDQIKQEQNSRDANVDEYLR